MHAAQARTRNRLLPIVVMVAVAASLVLAWLRFPVATEALAPFLVPVGFALLLLRAIRLRDRRGAGQEPISGRGGVQTWLDGDAPLAADMGGSGTWQEGVSRSLWATTEMPARTVSLTFTLPPDATQRRLREAEALASTRSAAPHLTVTAEGLRDPESRRAVVRLSVRGTPAPGEVARLRSHLEADLRRRLNA